MIVNEAGKLGFALESTACEFSLESSDRAIAKIPLSGQKAITVSLDCHGSQFHLTAHFPHNIRGKVAFDFLDLAADDPEAFNFWVDPSDGETTYAVALEEQTANHLDDIVKDTAFKAEKYWGVLELFLEKSEAQDESDKRAYNVERHLLGFFEGGE